MELMTNFFATERLSVERSLPIKRLRWLEPGDSFLAGDRRMRLVLPPIFDGPTTRGLFDEGTGVLWGVDSFAAMTTGSVHHRDDVPEDLYSESFALLNSLISPWHQWLDPARYRRHVDYVAALHPDTVATAHGPLEQPANGMASTSTAVATCTMPRSPRSAPAGPSPRPPAPATRPARTAAVSGSGRCGAPPTPGRPGAVARGQSLGSDPAAARAWRRWPAARRAHASTLPGPDRIAAPSHIPWVGRAHSPRPDPARPADSAGMSARQLTVVERSRSSPFPA